MGENSSSSPSPQSTSLFFPSTIIQSQQSWFTFRNCKSPSITNELPTDFMVEPSTSSYTSQLSSTIYTRIVGIKKRGRISFTKSTANDVYVVHARARCSQSHTEWRMKNLCFRKNFLVGRSTRIPSMNVCFESSECFSKNDDDCEQIKFRLI